MFCQDEVSVIDHQFLMFSTLIRPMFSLCPCHTLGTSRHAVDNDVNPWGVGQRLPIVSPIVQSST